MKLWPSSLTCTYIPDEGIQATPPTSLEAEEGLPSEAAEAGGAAMTAVAARTMVTAGVDSTHTRLLVLALVWK
jgi:hypothetical protein